MTTFSEWIEDSLKSRNWKPADLARAAGVPDATLSNVLNGKRKPGPDLCLAIATALGEPPEKVFRLAGLLPSLPNDDGDVQEVIDIIKNLPPAKRKQALDFLRYLYKLRD